MASFRKYSGGVCRRPPSACATAARISASSGLRAARRSRSASARARARTIRRYPRVPVLRCPGFTPRRAGASGAGAVIAAARPRLRSRRGCRRSPATGRRAASRSGRCCICQTWQSSWVTRSSEASRDGGRAAGSRSRSRSRRSAATTAAGRATARPGSARARSRTGRGYSRAGPGAPSRGRARRQPTWRSSVTRRVGARGAAGRGAGARRRPAPDGSPVNGSRTRNARLSWLACVRLNVNSVGERQRGRRAARRASASSSATDGDVARERRVQRLARARAVELALAEEQRLAGLLARAAAAGTRRPASTPSR